MKPSLRSIVPCAVLASVAVSGVAVAQGQAGAASLTNTTVVTGRTPVWGMVFPPGGTKFFTEKCRGLSVRLPSDTINPLLGVKDSRGCPETAADLFCSGQAGMSGIAIDPDFASNRLIYVFSASSLTRRTAPGTATK